MRKPKTNAARIPYIINYNGHTSRYEIIEKGILYAIKMEELRTLKEYYKADSAGTVAAWYSKQDKATKKNIIKIGGENNSTDFFADPEYEIT